MENAGGNAVVTNNNANLNKLNVANAKNKSQFVAAFKNAAEVAANTRFTDIGEKCAVLATTLENSNSKIDLSSAFGNYGNNRAPNKSAANNLNKVKEFTGSTNAPTRGVILIKILSEIKNLVKTRRNSNRRLAGNIKTAANFNKAIINLINAVNAAKKENTPAATANTPATTNTPPNAAKNAYNKAKNAYNKANNKSTAVSAYANAINAYANSVNVRAVNTVSAAKSAYSNANNKPAAVNAYASAVIAAVNAKKNQGNAPAAQQ